MHEDEDGEEGKINRLQASKTCHHQNLVMMWQMGVVSLLPSMTMMIQSQTPIVQEAASSPGLTKTSPTVSSGESAQALNNVVEPLEEIEAEDSASLERKKKKKVANFGVSSSLSDSLDTSLLEEEESLAVITSKEVTTPNKKEGYLRRRKKELDK